MKYVVIQSRQPFSTTPNDETVANKITELHAAGHEVDFVWLPLGETFIEKQDAEIAARLLSIEGTDRIITYGFPAHLVRHQEHIVERNGVGR